MKTKRMLVPREAYLKSGIHIGSRFKNKFMEKFIYKTRPDGLNIFNISKIDERLKAAAQLLAKYDPQDILVVCRRDNGFKAVKEFGKATGAKVITGRYLPGSLTNPNYKGYIEPKILVACDPWLDRQAIKDAAKANIPIIALAGTNAVPRFVDLIIPCNNKSKKSLGLVFYILAKEYLRERGQAISVKQKDFV